MLKKIYYWVFTILQVLFLIAAYVAQFFSMKKMGMMRYVIFLNHEWEAHYPISVLKYTAIASLIILCADVIARVIIKRTKYFIHKKTLPMLIADIMLTVILVLFTLIFPTENYPSYYITSLILAIVVLLQHIKLLIASVQR